MEVLLIKDVDNLGYAGDVKKVANGFGRNYLLPQQLAVVATPGALKQAETIRKAAEKQRASEMEDAKAIANQIEGLHLLFERRAGETGKLYGSVTSGDIADEIAAKTQIEIDKRKVALAEPIRNLGEMDVTIKLMIDLSTVIKVEVLPLGGILERERLTEAEAAKLKAEAVVEVVEVEETVVEEEDGETIITEITEEIVVVEENGETVVAETIEEVVVVEEDGETVAVEEIEEEVVIVEETDEE